MSMHSNTWEISHHAPSGRTPVTNIAPPDPSGGPLPANMPSRRALFCATLITLGVAAIPFGAQSADRLVGPPFADDITPKKPNDCTLLACTLTYAIQIADAGDHIVIQSGPVIAQSVVNKDLTIEAQSCPTRVRIDAQSRGRHFDVASARSATVTLRCLDLIHGAAAEGGAVRVGSQGALILKDSKIIGAGAAQNGGAILSNGAVVTVLDSELIDNRANGDGGAIRGEGGAITVRRSVIKGNEGFNGGFIDSDGAAVVVTASTLSGNHSRGGDGGALRVRTGSLLIGASSILEGNTASGHAGGAVKTEVSDLAVQVDTTLTENSAATGGAIAAVGGTVGITTATFEANSASTSGGALFLAGAAANISLSDFQGNSAEQDGGAIMRVVAGTLTISDSAFASNSAMRGGALADGPGVQTGSPVTTIVGRSLFAQNEAEETGGAIDRIGDGGHLHVVNSTFSENRAVENGGGIFNDPNGDLSIVHSTFVGNEATDGRNVDGGGFHSLGKAVLMFSILTGNTPVDCATVPASLTGRGNLAGSCHSDDGMGTEFSRGFVTNIDQTLGGVIGIGQTYKLQSGSNAIDLGPRDCQDPILGVPVTQDQTGRSRPFDGDADGVARCDPGAVEYTRLIAPQDGVTPELIKN